MRTLQDDQNLFSPAEATVARLDRAVLIRGDFRLGPLDFELDWGERVALLGPNGSGKTTVLDALLGTLPLEAGTRYVGPGVRIGELDQARGEAFYAAVLRDWPGLRDGALIPGYAGIRPKISAPSEPAADFVVQAPATHGVPGLVNLYGIESPGLTASWPLADETVRRLTEG